MTTARVELSRCPWCGARGVKQFDPIVLDGVPTDRPYCGKCGRNYPSDPPPERFTVLEWPKEPSA